MFSNSVDIRSAQWIREEMANRQLSFSDLAKALGNLGPPFEQNYDPEEVENILENGVGETKNYIMSMDLFLGAAKIFNVLDVQTLVDSWKLPRR